MTDDEVVAVLELAGEGGGYCIEGKVAEGVWRFRVHRDDHSMPERRR